MFSSRRSVAWFCLAFVLLMGLLPVCGVFSSLLVPLFLRVESRPLARAGGLTYSIVGACGAALLAGAWPPLLHSGPDARQAFALIGDAHLWLGRLSLEDYSCPTPDGRPVTREFAELLRSEAALARR